MRTPEPGLSATVVPSSRWRLDAPSAVVDRFPTDLMPPVPDGVVANLLALGALTAATDVKPGRRPQLAGLGRLTAIVGARLSFDVTLGGAGDLTASVSHPGHLSSTGGLTAAVWPGSVQTTPLTADGTLSAALTPIAGVTGPLAGEGILSTGIAATVSGELTGEGALMSEAVGGYPVTGDLTGEGTSTVDILPIATATAELTGEGNTGATLQSHPVTADLTGTGTLSATVLSEITDDFNRADASTLGPDYQVITTSPTIASGAAQGGSPSTGTTTIYRAQHTTALTADDQEVECVPTTPTGTSNLGLGGGVALRTTSDGSESVEVLFTGSQVVINTRIGGSGNNRVSASISTPTHVRMTAIGNTYSVYVNGASTPDTTWTDSGGEIGTGAANRYAGVVTVAETTFGGSTRRGYALDEWTARDL